ncbi:MAG: hypothetical protein L3J71_10650 [Victivallaceae bacterium]|nr:hypothetical protein [Victivallaceae bacterium]
MYYRISNKKQNGDPACDLVYTVNYAFIGLHEASMATNDNFYIEAENKLASFLCRIQVKSASQPYLGGCWELRDRLNIMIFYIFGLFLFFLVYILTYISEF